MVFAHLLNLTQRVAHHADTVRQGRWAECPDFCYWDYPLIELADLTMGVIGYGRIGKATAALAQAFGMRVVAYDPALAPPLPPPAEHRALDQVFQESDVVSLHCPLTADNERLVSRERLALMKPGAFLINTSRGPLVDEAALAVALNEGQLAGAGLDVLAVEPAAAGNPLLTARNCYVTPHIAWASRSSRARLLNTVVANVKTFLAGAPENVVNDL
jgi:glycerate dehydrogenase